MSAHAAATDRELPSSAPAERPASAAVAARWTPSRRAAAAIVALLVLVGLPLRAWEHRVGLPPVFHSDWAQTPQAAQLLRDGFFDEDAPYPVLHVYVLALADLVAFVVGRVGGEWSSWREFLDRLWAPDMQGQALQHAIVRLYTAFVGALLPIAVYLLARVRLGRGAALLAAAAAALSPVHVIYSHQARIHVPGLTALALAAIPVARLPVTRRLARDALIAGVAAGIVASIYQLGYLLAAAAGLAILARSDARATRFGACVRLSVAFAATVGLLWLVCHYPGVVREREGNEPLDNVWTLGVSTGTFGWRFWTCFPAMIARWVLAEPFVALGVVLYIAQAVRTPPLRSLALSYGLYPAIVFLVLGTNYEHVRYSMSVTPFLATLAAAACVAVRPLAARVLLGAALVGWPLACSLRYDALLDEPDTRELLREVLLATAGTQIRVAPSANMVLDSRSLPPEVEIFPPNSDYKSYFEREIPLQQALERLDADVFVGGELLRGIDDRFSLYPERAGYTLIARITPGPVRASSLPDAPDYIPDLWRTQRLGPPIEFWLIREGAREPMLRTLHRLELLELP